MHNITLISTMHDAVGECNPIALHKILLAIKPDIIFVEMPPSLFSKYYLERSKSKLEKYAVSMYLENFNAVTVPVDLDDIPVGNFFKEHQNVMERLLELTDINGENFRALVGTKKRYASIYGFSFLNSDHYIQYTDGITDAMEKGLENINDERFNLAYQKWNEFTDRRENEMLKNIYNYSIHHTYNKAVFLVGAGHRKSIKEKIEAHSLNELPKLNWVIYGE